MRRSGECDMRAQRNRAVTLLSCTNTSIDDARGSSGSGRRISMSWTYHKGDSCRETGLFGEEEQDVLLFDCL